MMRTNIFGLVLLLMTTTTISAQKMERDHIRRGNRAYKDSTFVNAEVSYRKAIDVNPKSAIAIYNLGNTLLQQNKMQEAMEQYVMASKIETDKTNLAQIYHNMGVILHSSKDYGKAVEAYKESLRNNPKDDETRYNLALAQKMLKDQEQNEQDQNQNQEQQQEQEKEQEQEQEKQDQQNQEQQQPPQPQDNQMSKENAEQLLKSVMQDEKDVQEKVKKQQVIQGGRLEKDW